MSSVPYSRYLVYPVTWYSFLIVAGAGLAIYLACNEERRQGLPKDTIIDLALLILPCGIIGARIYYVVFSWDQFSEDLFSIFRIWEGGLAVYGGIIFGFIALYVFCRKRRLPVLTLCDLIAPGLVLAQGIGRWGNWFNMEAFGPVVTDRELCFFPIAVQIPADGYHWHLATFFYESIWDFSVFLFLVLSRRKLLRKKGDVFLFYLFLYAAGRLVIEELRTDSLYTVSSVRVSQMLSALFCTVFLFYSLVRNKKYAYEYHLSGFMLLLTAFFLSAHILFFTCLNSFYSSWTTGERMILLFFSALLMSACLIGEKSMEVKNADNKS